MNRTENMTAVITMLKFQDFQIRVRKLKAKGYTLNQIKGMLKKGEE